MVDINLTIVIQAINFLVLVFVLKKVLWEPLMKHIDRRDALIAERREETARLRAEAERMRNEYSEGIRTARKEGIQLRDALIADGRSERLRLIGIAMDESERRISEGEQKLQNEKQATLAGITDKEIGVLAEQVVGRVLRSGRN